SRRASSSSRRPSRSSHALPKPVAGSSAAVTPRQARAHAGSPIFLLPLSHNLADPPFPGVREPASSRREAGAAAAPVARRQRRLFCPLGHSVPEAQLFPCFGRGRRVISYSLKHLSETCAPCSPPCASGDVAMNCCPTGGRCSSRTA